VGSVVRDVRDERDDDVAGEHVVQVARRVDHERFGDRPGR
jgi:hypothetical protein